MTNNASLDVCKYWTNNWGKLHRPQSVGDMFGRDHRTGQWWLLALQEVWKEGQVKVPSETTCGDPLGGVQAPLQLLWEGVFTESPRESSHVEKPLWGEGTEAFQLWHLQYAFHLFVCSESPQTEATSYNLIIFSNIYDIINSQYYLIHKYTHLHICI